MCTRDRGTNKGGASGRQGFTADHFSLPSQYPVNGPSSAPWAYVVFGWPLSGTVFCAESQSQRFGGTSKDCCVALLVSFSFYLEAFVEIFSSTPQLRLRNGSPLATEQRFAESERGKSSDSLLTFHFCCFLAFIILESIFLGRQSVGWPSGGHRRAGVHLLVGSAQDAEARTCRCAHGGDGLDVGRICRRLHRPRY